MKLASSTESQALTVGVDIPVRTTEDVLQEGKDVLQLTAFITPTQEAELCHNANGVEYGRWNPAFADITPKGVTKHQGIDVFCKHFGLQLEETMAFGDNLNDIGMLRQAGISYTVEEAREEVRQAADAVAGSCRNDGVLGVLKEIAGSL